MNTIELAKTIHQQIKATTPLPVIWSWGASAWQAVGENGIKLSKGNPYLGGLLFFVRGKVHHGHILIALDLNDTYSIYTGRLLKGNFKVKQSFSDVYVEDLAHFLDTMIETPEKGTVGAM